MRKFFTLLILIILVLGGALIFYPDAPLNTEAERWLSVADRDVVDEDNMFLAVAGFQVGEDKEPIKEATRLIAVANSTIQTARAARNYAVIDHDDYWENPPLVIQGSMPGACSIVDNGCARVYASQAEDVFEAVDQNTVLLGRYWELYSLPEYHNTLLADETSPFINVRILLQMNELTAAYAVGLFDSGAREQALLMLQEDIKFTRRFVQQADTLLYKVVAASMLKNTVLAYSELMDLASMTGFEAISSLTPAELSLEAAIRFEFRTIVAGIKYNIAPMIANDLKIPGFAVRPFHKTNQSINFSFEAFQRFLLFDKLSSQELAVRYGLGELDQALKPDTMMYITNPVGAILSSIQGPNLGNYYFRFHDLDGLIRLVNLKLEMKAKNMENAGVEEFLAKTEEPQRNPYTDEPMQWDQGAGTLYFDSPYTENGQVAVRLRLN